MIPVTGYIKICLEEEGEEEENAESFEQCPSLGVNIALSHS